MKIMAKVTLDKEAFKALASDTRLDILRCLDGKKMTVTELASVTNMNKATLHEHLNKLSTVDLIKRVEREGHKWVYYKLTWKGEGLLHPENTRIVVMFSTTFISLLLAVMFIVSFLQPIPVGIAETVDDTTYLYEVESTGIPLIGKGYSYNYVGAIDAKEKTVGNITTELLNKAPPENTIGDNYDDNDITWFELDSKCILTNEDSIYLKMDRSGSLEIFNIPIDLKEELLDNNQIILYSFYDTNLSNYNTENSNTTLENKTKGSSSGSLVDNNTMNQSSAGYKDNNMYTDSYPLVPTMIATVHDSTLLYFAAVCLTFFGILFILSIWRLLINRKQSL